MPLGRRLTHDAGYGALRTDDWVAMERDRVQMTRRRRGEGLEGWRVARAAHRDRACRTASCYGACNVRAHEEHIAVLSRKRSMPSRGCLPWASPSGPMERPPRRALAERIFRTRPSVCLAGVRSRDVRKARRPGSTSAPLHAKARATAARHVTRSSVSHARRAPVHLQSEAAS
jgi:hypothetical protein